MTILFSVIRCSSPLQVGLAVDDIKGTLEKAVLKRLTLQVELALSVEELLPTRLRRHFIIGGQEVLPNQAIGPIETLRHKVFGSDRFDSAENISEALHPALVRDHLCIAHGALVVVRIQSDMAGGFPLGLVWGPCSSSLL